MKEPPLSGLKVLELGQLIAGPFCGQLLGDFGASVVKIEAPGQPDPARHWGAGKVDGRSVFWPIIGRNKRSLTLNLRESEGQEILRELAQSADILVENFRPGTLERWGLGPDILHALNPRLIIVRISGYGQTGPEAHKGGFATIAEAKAGLRYLIGDPDRLPARAGVSLGDTVTGTFAALGAILALYARERSGRGQIVDSAIYESVLALMESLVPEYALAGHIKERSGGILPKVAPSGIYPCADGFVVIGANSDALFKRLAEMCGTDWASDPKYATHNARGERQAELDSLISEWTSARPVSDVIRLTEEFAIPSGPVNTAKDVFEDAHINARKAIIRVLDPSLGEVPMQSVFPYLSETPGRVDSTGPELGEHTEEVLTELGKTVEDIAGLRSRGIV